jgi:hypothetical protein
MARGQVVDTESAQEFMQESLGKISEHELHRIAEDLAVKSQRFSRLLAREAMDGLGEEQIRGLLRSIFSTRRRVDDLFRRPGVEGLRGLVRNLLYGSEPLPGRFQAFYDALDETEEHVRFDLPGELLHYRFPEECWLWTRWIWDPKTETGALPLVTMEGYDFRGLTIGETYMRVGEATQFVRATGEAAGFTRIGTGPFGIDVYLACVYAVYIYTTLRVRMTQEFNKVLPPLPELCSRLLGVHRMEV